MEKKNYCVFCDDKYLIDNADKIKNVNIKLLLDDESKDIVHIEYKCNICSSRIRKRNWFILYHSILKKLIDTSKVMIFSPCPLEKKLFSLPNTKFVTLCGEYGKDVIYDVDMQNLSKFEKNSFTFVQAINILDYIPNLKLALQQVNNILKNNGYFCFYIEMGRITRDKNKKYSFKKYNIPKHACWSETDVECVSHINLHVSYLRKIGNEIFSNVKIYEIKDMYSDKSCPSLFFLFQK